MFSTYGLQMPPGEGDNTDSHPSLSISLLPVLVWLSPSSSASSSSTDLLMERGVLLVTINSRQGALGFLSLGVWFGVTLCSAHCQVKTGWKATWVSGTRDKPWPG